MALNAAANKCPRPRDFTSGASRLYCVVGDFVSEDLLLNFGEGLLIHGVDPFRGCRCRAHHLAFCSYGSPMRRLP